MIFNETLSLTGLTDWFSIQVMESGGSLSTRPETSTKTKNVHIPSRTVDDLKADGHYFAAGALAFSLGFQKESYGPHFGMRSELALARDQFAKGWTAARDAA